MYVLDTNTVIYFFRGQGKVADNLLSTRPNDVANVTELRDLLLTVEPRDSSAARTNSAPRYPVVSSFPSSPSSEQR